MNKARLRQRFWLYCKRASAAAKARARTLDVPYDLDADAIDVLLVNQGWRCAVSGIELVPPWGSMDPFGPSLDRIVPQRGYVAGNVRVVCNIANFAMNQWGLSALQRLAIAMGQWQPQKPDKRRAVWRRTLGKQTAVAEDDTTDAMCASH